MSAWETVIGLEVHAQLSTRTKIWCGCEVGSGAAPNTRTCPVCLGLPGALPVLNGQVVDFAALAGLAVGCTVNARSVFARKNYFYPDLPKGYQISQHDRPICEHGELAIAGRTIRIVRIHLEEDAAKNLHGAAEGLSVVDYNRGGTPLVEIVSAPDLRSSDEAVEYLRLLRSTLLYLGINDGNMEEGNLRCDANVSVRPAGSDELRTRVELKNLNSFRYLKNAIEYEAKRQVDAYRHGETIVQETRLWDPERGQSRSLRSKEEAHDYRYFPDPDLLPVEVSEARLEKLKASLPELPRQKERRLVDAHGVAPADAETICAEPQLARVFERFLAACPNGRRLGNWFTGELARAINERLTTLDDLRFTPEELATLLQLLDANTLSSTAAKEVFAEMVEKGGDPRAIVEKRGLVQVSDASEIEAIVDQVISANTGEVEKYRAGKKNLIGFFVGQVMKAMRGRGNPAIVNEVLRRKLES